MLSKVRRAGAHEPSEVSSLRFRTLRDPRLLCIQLGLEHLLDRPAFLA